MNDCKHQQLILTSDRNIEGLRIYRCGEHTCGLLFTAQPSEIEIAYGDPVARPLQIGVSYGPPTPQDVPAQKEQP